MPPRNLILGCTAGFLLLLLLPPAIASACPTCFAASGAGGLRAYYLSTVLLSAMPFVMIGMIATVGYAVRRRSRRLSTDPEG
jgi:hypothetical protein